MVLKSVLPVSEDAGTSSIFERLAARGVGPKEYAKIKSIVTLEVPQGPLFFQRRFPRRKPLQVLRQVETWRNTCVEDYLIPDETKSEIESRLAEAEFLAWNALAEAAFLQPVGDWMLSQQTIRTSNDSGKFPFRLEKQVTATHRQTGEQRVAMLKHEDVHVSLTRAWQSAFAELGVLNLVRNLPLGSPLVSARAEQGWPVYTKTVIPRLYEFLLPYYTKRGHVWSDKEMALTRAARLPKELFEDMLDILKVEHPGVFDDANVSQLKALVSRYLERRTKSQKTRKTSK